MNSAIYPGSFDPPTLGHLNIIERAAKQFDKLIIAIGDNPAKKTTFSKEERVTMLKTITSHLPNIEIHTFSNLLVDFAKSVDTPLIIRAIRTIFDFEKETLEAQMNKRLGDLETFYLVVDEKYRLLSSTLVREIASHGKRLHNLVPEGIEEMIQKRLMA
jgi:pantetheine-phosphate adenylyltransferase